LKKLACKICEYLRHYRGGPGNGPPLLLTTEKKS
jgi:hypothetical protein